MSKLKGSFEAGTFVLTGEIAPPKGVNMGKVIDEVERYLSDNVCAVNVTDNQSAVMRLSSLVYILCRWAGRMWSRKS
jgi:5,10-methylenetetrahydrofolate reductase